MSSGKARLAVFGLREDAGFGSIFVMLDTLRPAPPVSSLH